MSNGTMSSYFANLAEYEELCEMKQKQNEEKRKRLMEWEKRRRERDNEYISPDAWGLMSGGEELMEDENHSIDADHSYDYEDYDEDKNY